MPAAPLPSRPRIRWVFAIATLLASAATACIIGPKQDDPADLREVPGPDSDAGTSADSSGGMNTDTGTTTFDASPPMDDAVSGDGATDAASDGATDAASDGAPVDGGCGDADAVDACATGGADAITGD